MMNPAPFPALLPAAINHLLAAEPWAQQKLSLHAGKVAVLDAGIAAIRFKVASDGLLERAHADDAADVTIHVRPADIPLILQNRQAAASHVKIEGDAALAATLSQLSESLRWDAEEDLSRLLGDVAAVRVVSTAKKASDMMRTSSKTITENLAEYLTEEAGVLIRPPETRQFAQDVQRLRDDTERLAKRIARLNKSEPR